MKNSNFLIQIDTLLPSSCLVLNCSSLEKVNTWDSHCCSVSREPGLLRYTATPSATQGYLVPSWELPLVWLGTSFLILRVKCRARCPDSVMFDSWVVAQMPGEGKDLLVTEPRPKLRQSQPCLEFPAALARKKALYCLSQVFLNQKAMWMMQKYYYQVYHSCNLSKL